MPRIEIIPQGWDESAEKKRGDGSPTVDVCMECSTHFPAEGELVPDDLLNALAETADLHYEGAAVGSTEVAHPPYDDEDYDCDCCGKGLTPDDD